MFEVGFIDFSRIHQLRFSCTHKLTLGSLVSPFSAAIAQLIKELREQRGGSLSGMTHQEIVSQVAAMIIGQQHNSQVHVLPMLCCY